MNTSTRHPSAASERRAAARRRPAAGTYFLPRATRLGLIWDITPHGVCLYLPDRPEPGASVVGELAALRPGRRLRVAVRVADLARLGSCGYLVGGPFDRPLTATQMLPFVGRA